MLLFFIARIYEYVLQPIKARKIITNPGTVGESFIYIFKQCRRG